MSAGAAIALAAAGPAAAQGGESVQRLERQMRQIDQEFYASKSQGQSFGERLYIDYGVVARFGMYGIDDASGNTHILRQTDAILYLQADLDNAHRFFGRARFLYDDWNTGDDFDGDGDELDNPIFDRYWYEYDLRNAVLAQSGERLDYNVNLRAGRQFVQWGSGLVLSNTLYSAIVDVEFFNIGVTGIAGITAGSSVVDFDASRPDFDDRTEREFYGAMLEYRGLAEHKPYAFFLSQQDENDQAFTFAGGGGPIPTRFGYQSNYVGVGSRGSFGPNIFYRLEGVYEFGEGESNSFNPATGLAVTQTKEDIRAAAGIVGLTYVFRDAWDTRLDLEAIAGSGDDDRLDSADTFGGNRPGTDDHSFNALGYVNTGLALAPEPANLFSLRLGASTSPQFLGIRSSSMRVGMNGFLFFKIDDNAPISVSTTTDSFVGGELDFLFDWQITSDVTFNLRYGVFFPGDAIPTGQDDIRHFIYGGVTYAF